MTTEAPPARQARDRVNIVIDQDIRDAFKRIALTEDRSFSGQVNRALREWLETNENGASR